MRWLSPVSSFTQPNTNRPSPAAPMYRHTGGRQY
uniref:Uncharacterized protein n=1 Tax=Arundo donax TaxID=35708 RepID=A0A0A8Y198_ARUDO